MKQALLAGNWDPVVCAAAVPGFSPRAALSVLKSTGRDILFVVHSGNVAEEASDGG